MSTYSTVAKRDLGRLEKLRQRVQAGVGHLGDAGAHGGRADARLLVNAGEDREQRGLADHGQADNGSFHRVRETLQGNFHLTEDFFDDALGRVGAPLGRA